MLEILYKDNGELKAVCEWWMVNKEGKLDPHGTIVWVAEIEVTKSEQNNGSISKFIKIITDKVPYATHAYFWRQRKYPDRPQHTYSKEKWLRRIHKET